VLAHREPLAITGEVLCRVGPLDLPASTRRCPTRRRARCPAFADRPPPRNPGSLWTTRTWWPSRDLPPADGMPLALELAAARLRR